MDQGKASECCRAYQKEIAVDVSPVYAACESGYHDHTDGDRADHALCYGRHSRGRGYTGFDVAGAFCGGRGCPRQSWGGTGWWKIRLILDRILETRRPIFRAVC